MSLLALLRAAVRRLPPHIRRALGIEAAEPGPDPAILDVPSSPAVAPYPVRHAAEVEMRRSRAPAQPAPCRFSLLTTLYHGSSAGLFEAGAAAVVAQTHADFEWIILEKGVLEPALRDTLDRWDDPRVRRIAAPDLPIVAGMRRCLDEAAGEYAVPLDYDDVLTEDALFQLGHAIVGAGRPGLVFSDEDLLSDERGLFQPYRRPGFDPVLNATDSYIWHLCAFERERAIALGAYTEAAAEFCHDWDTVTRFAEAGERIVHVPEVLYHWRTHEGSASNSGEVNQGSLRSVRAMLERRIALQREPDRYEVAAWPIARGFEQYTILRRPVGECPVGRGIELVLGDGVAAPEPAAVWEAVRLFEMNPDMGAVGGRVLDAADMVVQSCAPVRGEGWVGRHRTDGGDYAHALKPQTVAGLSPGLFFCRAEVAGADAREVEARCRERGWRLAYSPLVEARRTGSGGA